jgi:hypothetical protein
MPKLGNVRIRRRHVKRVLMIIAYGFIVLVMVAGAVAPSLQF